MATPKIEIERQEPLSLPPEEDFDVFKNSDTEMDSDGEVGVDDADVGSEGSEGSDQEPEEELTPYEIANRKSDGLVKLYRFIDSKRYTPKRQLDMSNTLEEIENEVMFVERTMSLQAGISSARNTLLFCTSSIETLSTYIDPNTAMMGWHQKVDYSVEAGDYDAVLEELYKKYADRIAFFGPELQLAFLLIQSAVVHCVSGAATRARYKQQFETQEPIGSRMSPTDPEFEDAKEEIKDFTGLTPEVQGMFDDFIQTKEKKPRKPRKK